MPKKRNSQPYPKPEVLLDSKVVDAFAEASAPAASPVNTNGTPVGSVVPNPVSQAISKLMDVDKLALDLARQRRQTALAEAKTALAQNENAELSYKYTVLQIYMKYGLTDADAISEAGDIIRGGALPQNQVPVK